LGHLAELEVPDLDEGLVRRVGGATHELRRELFERLVQVAFPQPVGLHRVEIGVHDLEAVLHGGGPPPRIVYRFQAGYDERRRRASYFSTALASASWMMRSTSSSSNNR